MLKESPLTIDNANTASDLASLFDRLVTGKSNPIRDEASSLLFKEIVSIVIANHGGDGGPFSHILNNMKSRIMSDLQAVASRLESLPIDRDGIADYRPLYFVLDVYGEKWTPCYNAEDNRENGWITGGIRYTDGSTEVVPAYIGKWADCDADGNPSMPYVEW